MRLTFKQVEDDNLTIRSAKYGPVLVVLPHSDGRHDYLKAGNLIIKAGPDAVTYLQSNGWDRVLDVGHIPVRYLRKGESVLIEGD